MRTSLKTLKRNFPYNAVLSVAVTERQKKASTVFKRGGVIFAIVYRNIWQAFPAFNHRHIEASNTVQRVYEKEQPFEHYSMNINIELKTKIIRTLSSSVVINNCSST